MQHIIARNERGIEWTRHAGGNKDAVYMDFLKAFDLVNHLRLLFKLKNNDIPHKVETLLSNRRQRVKINGIKVIFLCSTVPSFTLFLP